MYNHCLLLCFAPSAKGGRRINEDVVKEGLECGGGGTTVGLVVHVFLHLAACTGRRAIVTYVGKECVDVLVAGGPSVAVG
jgi:hypothetical protein